MPQKAGKFHEFQGPALSDLSGRPAQAAHGKVPVAAPLGVANPDSE